MSETRRDPGTSPEGAPLDALLKDAREAPLPVHLEGVFEAVEEGLRTEARRPGARLRALRTSVRHALCFGLVLAMLAMIALLLPRPDLGTLPFDRHLWTLGGVGLLLGISLRGALRPAHLPSLGGARATSAVLLAVSVTAALSLLAPSGVAPDAAHYVCFLGGLGMGLPVFVLARLLDRGTLAGPLLAATSGGLAGYLALHMHCGIDDRLHLLLGHGAVVLAFVVVAAVARWARGRPLA